MKCWKMEKEERNGHEVFWDFNQMANLIPTLFSHSFIELTFLPRVGLFHKWPSVRSWSSINKVSIFISTFDVINLTLALREEIIKKTGQTRWWWSSWSRFNFQVNLFKTFVDRGRVLEVRFHICLLDRRQKIVRHEWANGWQRMSDSICLLLKSYNWKLVIKELHFIQPYV